MIPRFRHVAALLLSVALLTAAGCSGAESRKARYMSRGDEYFAAQNFEKARVEYSNALQIDPKDAKARYFTGQIAEKLNKPRDALGSYQAAVDADPDYVPARAALGRLYLLGGLRDKAEEIVAAGLIKKPDDPQLRTVRGAVRAQNGNNAGALEDAEMAVKVAPGDEFALALLAALYRQAGRSEDAITMLAKGIEHTPRNTDLRVILAELQVGAGQMKEAESLLRSTVEIEPANLAHWQRLARFHLLAKDPAAAEQAMRDAVKAVPDSIETKMSLVELLAAQRGAETAEQQMQAFVKAEPAKAELKLALGRFYEAGGKADRAATTYQEIIAAEGVKPRGLEARDRLAAVALQGGDVTRAEKLLAEVLAENARDNEALALRGSLALARGDATAAITDLRAVLRDQPNAVAIVRTLARAHLQNNEAALAEEALRAAMQANPKDIPLRLDLAALLAQSDKLDMARPILEQLILDAPTNVAARESFFKVQLALKDYVGAHQTAEDIRRLQPNSPLGSMYSGIVNEREKKFAAAASDYEAAQKLKPETIEPLTALVRLDISQQQIKRAQARIAEVVGKYPDNLPARNLMGEVYLGQAQYDDAIRTFEAISEKAPKWWVPYRGKAFAQAAAKRNDEAVATMTTGLEKTGGSVELAGDLAALNQRLGRHDDAIKVYDDILKRSPRSLFAANNLAMLLVTHRKDQASLDRAANLVEQLGNSAGPMYLDTRGWVKFKRGEFEQALPLLQQAADKAPASQEILYHLGMAQFRSGNRIGAQASLEAALKTGSGFEGAAEARAALETVRKSS